MLPENAAAWIPEPIAGTDAETHSRRGVLFHAMVRGLAAQGWKRAMAPASDGVEVCAYRGADGTKCAAGHLIDDDEIPEGSNAGLGIRFLAAGKTLRHIDSRDLVFVSKLQGMHDSNPTPLGMRAAFSGFAAGTGLPWPGGVKNWGDV